MIRMMEEKDLDRIAELEDQLFPADPWQKKNFLYEMNDNPYARLFVFETSLFFDLVIADNAFFEVFWNFLVTIEFAVEEARGLGDGFELRRVIDDFRFRDEDFDFLVAEVFFFDVLDTGSAGIQVA